VNYCTNFAFGSGQDFVQATVGIVQCAQSFGVYVHGGAILIANMAAIPPLNPGGIPQGQKPPAPGNPLPQQLENELQTIYQNRPPQAQQCDAAARETMDAFQRSGYQPQRMGITDQLNAPIWRDGTGRVFTQTGYHEAVVVDGRVYDALTGARGMEMGDYLDMLRQWQIKPVTRLLP
jgi:hypothetical protein